MSWDYARVTRFTLRFIQWRIETVVLSGSENRTIEAVRMNLLLVSDSWDVSTANFQSSALFVVYDKDCDIAVETNESLSPECTQCQNNSTLYTS